jgi:putative transposase
MEMKKRHQAACDELLSTGSRLSRASRVEEIIRILRDIEAGGNVAQGIRRHNISEQTFYRWKQKYGGMSQQEGKRLREVERENQKLKKIVAEQTLIIDGLREISAKKW